MNTVMVLVAAWLIASGPIALGLGRWIQVNRA
jgi:hypothetical protein